MTGALKSLADRADTGIVHLERLVIDSGEHTFAADFHPRFTVIGGLKHAARTALAGEVIESLGGAKPGVHLELETSDRSLTVFRPVVGRHRVIDTGSVDDVTDDYLGNDGSIDLFAALGVDRTLGQRAIRVSSDDLVLRGATDEYVSRLASVDQETLWETAMRLKAANQLLEHVSSDSAASTTDVELLDAVEEKHAELVKATENYDKIRLVSLTLADIGAIVGLALTFSDNATSGFPFLLMAIAGVLLALYFRRSVSHAEKAERNALSFAGAEDYTSFHVERVSALLDSDAERRRFMEAVSGHRKASEEWKAIAGDISLVFALDHTDQIRLSAEVQSGVRSLQNLSETAPHVSADTTAELAQALLNRIEAVRALTPGAEVLPMVVDDAFEDLEPTVKPMLLDMLSASAGAPQVIFLTADEDVISWARTESMTGDVAVVEPTVQANAAPVSRHGVASTLLHTVWRAHPRRATMSRVQIRPATIEDAEATVEIYNAEVVGSDVTFDLVPRSVEDQRAWLDERAGALEVVVAEIDGVIAGFASLSTYRERAAYRGTVEDSVYVGADARGQGVGRELLHAIVDVASSRGFHTVIGRIVGGHDASIALHRAAGFDLVGVEREVGRKFGRWLDVVVMQKML